MMMMMIFPYHTSSKAIFDRETNLGTGNNCLCSSNMALCDFSMFLKLKFLFESLEYIESKVITILKGLLETVFQQYFQAWQKWKYCITE
jgi:hypothetical protein